MCQPGPDTAGIQKSRETEHRRCEGADTKEAVHYIIAIDETHEPFYGKIKNLWIRDYTNGVKGATGAYKYIVVSIVSGDLRFILLVIPIQRISMETDYYV